MEGSPWVLPLVERALTRVRYLLGSRAVDESFRLLKAQAHRQRVSASEARELFAPPKCGLMQESSA